MPLISVKLDYSPKTINMTELFLFTLSFNYMSYLSVFIQSRLLN